MKKINFGRIMQQIALRYSSNEALVNLERNRRYTYSEFHLLTNRIGNMVQSELGVGIGDFFMLILENDNLALLQVPTIFKQPGTVVMTNFRDSLEEHRRQAETVNPKAIFLERSLLNSHADMLESLGAKIVVMDPLSDEQRKQFPNVLEFDALISRASDAEVDVVIDRDEHIPLVRFTGGTTGKGKCAMYSVDNMLSSLETLFLNNQDLGFDANTRMVHVAPISHGSGLFLYPTYYTGGTTITLNTPDLDNLRKVIEREKATHTFLVPTALYRLLELQKVSLVVLTSLRTVIYGAAPMHPSRLSELVECFGQIFVQAYAATEVPCIISSLPKADHTVSSEKGIKRLASTGFITSGIEVEVVDANRQPVPAGVQGELRIRCKGVIRGYLGAKEQTDAEFADGYWYSGDVGYIDEDGYLYLVDRLKDMIITGGFNVYAGEVEVALGAHPAVLNSAVIGIPHPEWGESVHAEVILREGQSLSDQELIAFVKSSIGSYKTPKTIIFVDELPLSPVGKVLRRTVREKYRNT